MNHPIIEGFSHVAIVATDLLKQEINRGGDPSSGPFRPEHHEDYGLWLRLFAGRPWPDALIMRP